MVIISYDISDDKLRNRFSKYLEKFGHRIQFSVFEIDNSERMLKSILAEISNDFEKKFTQSDSIIILKLSRQCKVIRYGYAKNEESDIMVIS